MNAKYESPDRIVVGVDGSPSSLEALRWAARIAPLVKCHIDAVTAWEIVTSYGFGGTPANFRPDADAAHVLDVALKDVFGDTRPDGLRALVVEGHPAPVLLEACENAEMLVVGSRGHGGFVGLLIGSVSAHAAEHALCPVVVVHDPREQSGDDGR